jgi:hypothetical protein
MNIKLSNHARRRLSEERQNGITYYDVVRWARRVPGNVTEFRHRCKSQSGRRFDLVLDDKEEHRLVVTIIGK